jgi:N-ethylmaleimide reductase
MMEPSAADLDTGTVILKEPSKTFRSEFSGTMISNVGFSKDSANQIIQAGTADLVSFGKDFISNPDLPFRLKMGADLNKVDFSTLFTPGAKGYTDYPSLTAG